jgi:hypothetical protein
MDGEDEIRTTSSGFTVMLAAAYSTPTEPRKKKRISIRLPFPSLSFFLSLARSGFHSFLFLSQLCKKAERTDENVPLSLAPCVDCVLISQLKLPISARGALTIHSSTDPSICRSTKQASKQAAKQPTRFVIPTEPTIVCTFFARIEEKSRVRWGERVEEDERQATR